MTREKFSDYYKKKEITSTYSQQRLATKYRRKKRAQELKIFLSLLDKKEDEKVLEIGVSNGFLFQHLGESIGIDSSPEMLKLAKEKNPKGIVLEADMFKLPFKENSFDKIITMRVWNHLNEKDLRLIINESKRVLKKNGYLIFDIETKNWLRRFVNFFYKRIFSITGFKIYQYSYGEIKKILNDESFKIKEFAILNHRVGNQMIFKAQKL